MRIANFLPTIAAIAGLMAAHDSMTDAGAGRAQEFKMAGAADYFAGGVDSAGEVRVASGPRECAA